MTRTLPLGTGDGVTLESTRPAETRAAKPPPQPPQPDALGAGIRSEVPVPQTLELAAVSAAVCHAGGPSSADASSCASAGPPPPRPVNALKAELTAHTPCVPTALPFSAAHPSASLANLLCPIVPSSLLGPHGRSRVLSARHFFLRARSPLSPPWPDRVLRSGVVVERAGVAAPRTDRAVRP